MRRILRAGRLASYILGSATVMLASVTNAAEFEVTAGYVGTADNGTLMSAGNTFAAAGISRVVVSDGTAGATFSDGLCIGQGNVLCFNISIYDTTNTLIGSYQSVTSDWQEKTSNITDGFSVEGLASLSFAGGTVTGDSLFLVIPRRSISVSGSGGSYSIRGSADPFDAADANAVLSYLVAQAGAPAFEEDAGFNGSFTEGVGYSFDYDENAAADTVLGKVLATDPEGDPLTYAITAGNDDGWFKIDPDTGEITLTANGLDAAANDFELTANIWTLTVRASDGTNTTDVTVVLNEADVNDVAPAFEEDAGFNGSFTEGTGYSFDYDENAAADTVLGKVLATDPEGDALTYAITAGNDDGWFKIDPDTGEITLTANGLDAAANDFETAANIWTLTVRASDGTNTTDITVVLNEADVNDAAPAFAAAEGFDGSFTEGTGYSFDYDENAAADTVLGKVLATDPEGDALTYAITAGNDDGWFQIDPDTGEITLTASGLEAAANDFEIAANIWTLTVRASDGTNTTDVTVVLNERSVTEPQIKGPSGAAGDGEALKVVQAGTKAVHQFVAEDQGEPIDGRWSIRDLDAAKFEIDPETGELAFLEAPPFIPNGDNIYQVWVVFTFGENETVAQLVTIEVRDTALAALDRNRDDIEQIIADAEISKMRGQQNALRAMTSSARDRLSGGACGNQDDEQRSAAMQDDETCRIEDSDWSVDAGENGVSISGSNHTVRTFDGYRRIATVNLSMANDDNVRTLSFNGHFALENFRAEDALYGIFAGVSLNKSDVSRTLSGSADSYGLSLGAYAVHELARDIFSEAYVSLGRSQNQLELSDGYLDVAADYGTTEAHLGWILSGHIEKGDWDVLPELGIQLSRSRSSSIDVTGSIPDGDEAEVTWDGLTATLARANLSSDFRYYMGGRADDAWMLNFKPGIVCERVDAIRVTSGCGLAAGLGLNRTSADGAHRFSAEITAEEIRNDRRSGGRLTYELRF